MFRLRKRPKKTLNLYLRLFHGIEAEYINQKQNNKNTNNFSILSPPTPPPKKKYKVNSGEVG